MKRPEQALHQTVARYLDLALPADAWWTTIPLGGGGRLRGAFLKSMGAKKGTPDILIVYQGFAHFIELKGPKGTLSDEQTKVAVCLESAGAFYGVCHDLGGVHLALSTWHIPAKARIAA